MRREDKLQIRQGLRQSRNNGSLPLRMNMKVDLVHEHDTTIVHQLFARRASHAHVIEKVTNPSNESLVAVRQGAKRYFCFLYFEEILAVFQLASEAHAL